ncbi:MAG TPA: AAA family ATPase, partial [Elusimicrobiota bacterium]|nr:AAA family ATPase [Elusimicrobiota bacterium]
MRKYVSAVLAAALLLPGPSFAATVTASIPLLPAAPPAFSGAALSAAPMAPSLAPAPFGGLSAASAPLFAAPAAAPAVIPAEAAPALAAGPVIAAAAAPADAPLAAVPASAAAPASAPALSARGQVRAAASIKEAPDLERVFDGAALPASPSETAAPAATTRRSHLSRAARPAAAAFAFAAALAHAAPAAAAQQAHAAAPGSILTSLAASLGLFVVVSAIGGAIMAAAVRKWRAHREMKAVDDEPVAKGADTHKGFTSLGLFDRNSPESRAPETPQPKVTFADIAGQDDAKAELENVVDFLKNKDAYLKINPKVKGYKGVLLMGPPGTGKTLIARAVANEAGVPFVARKASDFINQFVGTGAGGIRAAFQEVKRQANGGPGILFIDEIDSIGMNRSGDANNAEETRTINALLAEMDGFEKDNIVVIAATNRADMLDPALLRGGRFGLKVPVGLPDVVGREAIFKIHMREMALEDGVNVADLAKQTPGLAGADLEEIVNDVTMKVGKRRGAKAAMADFLKGVDRFTTGHERRTVMRDDEKLAVSYHEAGHTLVSMLLPDADPVRKVTNIPHGLNALGFMQAVPEIERHMYSREWLIDRMAVGLGGRAAEKMMTGRIYSGASNDLLNVTRIAREMVMRYGMSEKVGLISYDSDGEPLQSGKPLSGRTRRLIDAEVRALVA